MHVCWYIRRAGAILRQRSKWLWSLSKAEYLIRFNCSGTFIQGAETIQTAVQRGVVGADGFLKQLQRVANHFCQKVVTEMTVPCGPAAENVRKIASSKCHFCGDSISGTNFILNQIWLVRAWFWIQHSFSSSEDIFQSIGLTPDNFGAPFKWFTWLGFQTKEIQNLFRDILTSGTTKSEKHSTNLNHFCPILTFTAPKILAFCRIPPNIHF